MGLPYYPPPPPTGTNPELERLKASVAQYFPVYETRITPNSLVLLVHADPATLEDRFDRLRQELWPKFYVPQIRYERGEYLIEVVRRPPRSPWGTGANLVLLAATFLTTVTAGAIFWLSYRGGSTLAPTDFLWGAVYFGLPLMTILGTHELAHYVVARRHHVEASLPFFLPVPPPWLIFGTFGAFISLREPIPSKKALLDIGAAGPLAGFAVAIPVTLGGLYLSAHSVALPLSNCGPVVLGVPFGNLLIGPSLFWTVLSALIPGATNLHPLALAGWVGLLVTAMNLLPAGQLDGGHVFRALFGSRTTIVSFAAVLILVALGIFTSYLGWILFAFLIFVLGVRHPPPLNDLTPLDLRRYLVGALAVGVLVGGFVLVPIATPTGELSITDHTWAHGSTNGTFPNGTGMVDHLSLTVQDQDFVQHGLVLSGAVTSAVVSLANQTTPLSGAALQAFESNATWTIVLPNGNTTSYVGTGNFSVPKAQYSPVGTDASVTFDVTFADPRQATVSLSLTVAAICNEDYQYGPQSQSYVIS